MPRPTSRLLAAGLGLGLALLSPLGAVAQTAPAAESIESNDPAARPIRAFYDGLLYAMKHAKQLGVLGRFHHLEAPVANAFDFDTMTKLIIGESWKNLSDAERHEIVVAFRRLTVADYARNFDDYGGESFAITSKVEMRGEEKLVATEMLIPNKPPIPFTYRMQKTAAGWRIVDIYLNGFISEVATRRSDFASTLRSGGTKALTQKLDAMVEQTLKE